MTQEVFNAIQEASKDKYPCTGWYDKKEINEGLAIATKNGWAFRASNTQCHWLEKGIEEAKKCGLLK